MFLDLMMFKPMIFLGYSDYDYDAPSVTDDTDDYVEIQDVINERRVSRSKIFDLERELEGQQDIYRASEVAKDRQIKSLIREIEGNVYYFCF